MWGLLTTGDLNPRHHVPGATGSMLIAPFILALLGIAIIVTRRRLDPWWRFIIFGALVSVIPGALTNDPFHTGRMIAYAIFLLVLTIPALEWLLGKAPEVDKPTETGNGNNKTSGLLKKNPRLSFRRALLVLLLLATFGQAAYFQVIFWREGPTREIAFDVAYNSSTTWPLNCRQDRYISSMVRWGPDTYTPLYALLEGRTLRSSFTWTMAWSAAGRFRD